MQERPVAFGPLGLITFARTYAREKRNGERETFSEAIERELSGIKRQLKLDLSPEEEEFYREMTHNMWGSVGGRFKWQLGTKTVERHGMISLNNCFFTKIDHPVRPFTWAMDVLMLGGGVGFSIQREHVYKLPPVLPGKVKIRRQDDAGADFVVPDSREGWVKLLGKVLKAHFYSGEGFTYSCQLIRSYGAPIKGFGGVASGPEILVEGIENIVTVLQGRRGKQLRPIDCLDVMNIIGSIVVAGNVRRSAQIALGDFDDIEFLKAKRWDLGNIPNWRAMSNNTIVTPDNMKDIPDAFWETYQQGEPYGLFNKKLSQSVGRLGETEYPDPQVEGTNPCGEVSLEDKEPCNLGEVFLPNIPDFETFLRVITRIYRINKHSLMLPSHHPETEEVSKRNMRIGIGITGLWMATKEQLSWLDPGYRYLRSYDKEYSKSKGWPESIKLTTIKPSGTLSLLAGVTPGAHPSPGGEYYIRRIRMAADSPLVEVCRSHGYYVEYVRGFDGKQKKDTVVVEFPCWDKNAVSPDQLDFTDYLEMVQFLQKNWADNAVSVSVNYKVEDVPRIKDYLEKNFSENFKALSFILYHGHGFDQAPYEPISKEKYEFLAAKVRPITRAVVNEEDTEDFGACSSGACPIK